MSIVQMSYAEKRVMLTRLIGRILKILHLVEEKQHNYKDYLAGLINYVHGADDLFDSQLVDIVVKLNSLYIGDLEYKQIRRIVLECKNNVNFLIENLDASEKEGVVEDGKDNPQQ